MRRSRTAVSALALSAAALVGLVLHEGYIDRAIFPVKGDVPTLGFGSTIRSDGSPVRLGDTTRCTAGVNARHFAGPELVLVRGQAAGRAAR